MDKDRIKGKAKDVKGRIKRQVGEWTGDEKTQVEGAAEQAKGRFKTPGARRRTPGAKRLDQQQAEQAGRAGEDDDVTERRKPAA